MSHPHKQIMLASQSPRRCELLEQIGITYWVKAPDIDESSAEGEPAEDYVVRLAESKASVIQATTTDGVPVLGADTVVVHDNVILTKPSNPDHANAMLERLSGRNHEVLTAIAVVARQREVLLTRTRVWFREISAAERRAYVATKEPLDKAGGYAIQGLAAMFITRIDGSYSGVMGLPLYETAELLAKFGVHPDGFS